MGTWFGVIVAVYGIPIVVYLVFAIPALVALRTRELGETATALWALTILAVPVMGPVAFAFLAPGVKAR
jgi:hypothetical protein